MFITERITVCPCCRASSNHIGFLEDSDEILECGVCGAEWEQTTGEITLDPTEL